jgi:histone-lysine N-methyltransferase SETD1
LSFDSGFSFQHNVGPQFQYNQQSNGVTCPDGSNWGQTTPNNVHWDPQTGTWVENTCTEPLIKKSPVRESLDSRIELLLKQQSAGLAPSFLGELGSMSGIGSPPFVSKDFKTGSPKNNRKNNQTNDFSNSRQHRNYRHDNDSDAILGTPPSPFLSASDFIKWYKVTKEIDSGKMPSLDSDDEDNDDMEEDLVEDDATPLKDEPQESKKSRNKTSKKTLEDDDDDRMSLSSLSSNGEKLQVGGDTSEPSTSAGGLHPHSHPMYPSEHVQMMARLGIWKPGMGSDIGLGVYTSSTAQPNFTSPSAAANVHFGPFMFQSMTGQSFATPPRASHPFPPQPPQPPCFYPGYIASPFSSMTAPIAQSSQMSHLSHTNTEWQKQSNEVRKSQLTRNALNVVVAELKELIKKDICKKMVENSAFKIYENWWDESERKSKTSGVLESDHKVLNKSDEQWPTMNSLCDNNRNESVNTYNSYGYGLGLRAAIPKMPSFRRKFKKPASPNNFDDGTVDTKRTESDIEMDKISDESDGETYRRRQARAQKNRAAAIVEAMAKSSSSSSSSESSSSSSSDSSSSDSSSSSNSDSDSESSSSSSSSSSSMSSTSSSSSSSSSSNSLSSRENRKKKYRKHRSSHSKVDLKENLSRDRSQRSSSYDSDSSKSRSMKNRESKSETQKSQLSTNNVAINKMTVPPNEQSAEPNSEFTSSLEYEASQALMALASGFSSMAKPSDSKDLDFRSKNKMTNEVIKDGDFPSKTFPMSENGSDTESASEVEKYENEQTQTSIAFDHSYCLPSEKPSDIDSVIDSVARGMSNNKDKQMFVSDHMYSRANHTSPQTKPQKRQYKRRTSTTTQNKSPNQDFHHSLYAVASEWRKAKRTPSNVVDIMSEFAQSRSPSPQPIYKKRDLIEEMNILYEFLKNGIDSEDVTYMKRSYEAMLQQEDNQIWWLNDIHWVDHPPTHIMSPKKKRKTDDSSIRVHQTGCARSEGYYKMDVYEKARLSHVSNTSVNSAQNEDEDIPKQLRARQATTQQSTREARSNQRRLLATVDAAWSDLLKFNQLQVISIILSLINFLSLFYLFLYFFKQFRKKQLKFAKSRIHDWGLFALEPIAADEMVIEYVGQGIRPIVADIREKKYSELGIGSSYLFRVDLETIVDATRCGNVARFINHSCNVCLIQLPFN